MFGLRSGRVEFDPLVARPRHIKLIIDELLNESSFRTILPQKRIGIIGFSLGAYTALNASGAQPDFSGLAAYCEIESQDFLLCGVQARQRLSTISSNFTSRMDSRIGGVVLLAPAYGPLFTENSFTNVTTPVRIYSAEKDEELDGQHHAKHFEKLLSSRVLHKIVKNAGHFVFISPCSSKLKLAVPTICNDDKFVDRVEIHWNLNRDFISFFKEVL